MRIIFLDVDGVLNCMSTKDDAPCGCIGVDSRKVEVLKKILEESRKEEETEVVLSSSWRVHVDRFGHRQSDKDFLYLLDKLKEQDIILYDETPLIDEAHRGVEIRRWLYERQNLPITGILIIDDEAFDFKNKGLSRFHMKTSFYNANNGGLQEKHVRQAMKLLHLEVPRYLFTEFVKTYEEREKERDTDYERV